VDVTHDRHPGVGGEGGFPFRIVSLDGPPKANPSRLQSIVIGDIASPLASDEGVHQPIVLLHPLLDSLRCQRFPCTFAHEIPPLSGLIKYRLDIPNFEESRQKAKAAHPLFEARRFAYLGCAIRCESPVRFYSVTGRPSIPAPACLALSLTSSVQAIRPLPGSVPVFPEAEELSASGG
jgi:hypothetical protein